MLHSIEKFYSRAKLETASESNYVHAKVVLNKFLKTLKTIYFLI